MEQEQRDSNDGESKQIGRYRLLKQIGKGGMGCVYKAYDTKLERMVALKLLPPSIKEDEEAIQRFEREAKSNAKLRHPNIVALYDFEREGDSYFITMDFIEGCTLGDFMRNNKIACDKVCQLMMKILEGIGYAHEKGLIHRDIKPANILMDTNENLFITDFGLAKATAESCKISKTGHILGTPSYMSPEQINILDGTLDHRSDIYSLGTLFYEMITGVLPFSGDPLQILGKIIYQEPRPPREINAIIPEEVERICLKAMAKKRELRYPCAQEMIDDLRQYLGQKEVAQRVTPANSRKLKRAVTTELPIQLRKYIEKKTPPPTPLAKTLDMKQDAVLEQLLLSLDIMNVSQLSECLSIQADARKEGICKSLGEIVEEKGYIDKAWFQNLIHMKDQAGNSLIPGYEIVKFIAEGTSAVYLGKDLKTGNAVAIKLYAPNISDMSSTMARFMRESEVSKKMDHPNIVRSTDFGTIHNIYYLVMDYVSGLSLSQIIAKAGRLEEKKALDLLEQLAQALAYAWKKNIIHRDIKPDNILSDGDTLKLSNLGFAKMLESDLKVTQEGNVVGTSQFMSPEQFEQAKDIDYRSDVYSVGVTFYLMLTGNLPFSASTKLALANEHLHQHPPPVEKFNVSLSKPTKALLFKMLEKNRDDRCSGIAEFLEDIDRVRHGKFPRQSTSLLSFRKFFLWGGLAATLLLAVLGLSCFYKA